MSIEVGGPDCGNRGSNDRLERFLGAAGGSGSFEISIVKTANCLDKKKWSENLGTISDSKEYPRISKIDRGLKAEKSLNQFPNQIPQLIESL